jgi:hypothetical protein
MPSSETPSEPFMARNVPHSWTTRPDGPLPRLAAAPSELTTMAAAVKLRTQAIRMRSFTASSRIAC